MMAFSDAMRVYDQPTLRRLMMAVLDLIGEPVMPNTWCRLTFAFIDAADGDMTKAIAIVEAAQRYRLIDDPEDYDDEEEDEPCADC
jgi:hypothetical protein